MTSKTVVGPVDRRQIVESAGGAFVVLAKGGKIYCLSHAQARARRLQPPPICAGTHRGCSGMRRYSDRSVRRRLWASCTFSCAFRCAD